VCDNMVRMDSIATDFHLLHASLPVPALQTRWIQQTDKVMTTVLTAVSEIN